PLRRARLPHGAGGGRGAARGQQHRRHRRHLLLPAAEVLMRGTTLLLTLLTLAPGPAGADCVNEAEKARLLGAKRNRRGSDRDFVKAGRHELSLFGGYYVSDLFDGTYIASAAYTYHLTEDVGIEAS